MLTSRLRRGGERRSGEGEADGFECGDGAAAGGFDDGSDVGIKAGTPLGAKAIGDFAEGDAGAQRPLGAVVCRRNGPVGDEDEHVAADFLDPALELDAGRVRWRAAHEFVEAGFEARGIGFERHVRELVSPSANPAGSTKQMVQTGCENAVAGVDGILHVANEMSEADCLFSPSPSGRRSGPRPRNRGGTRRGTPRPRICRATAR